MRSTYIVGVLIALQALASLLVAEEGSADRPLAHAIYFDLKNDTEQSRQEFIRNCQRKLAGLPGVVYLSAGELAADLDRPVNDRNFDVFLLIIFRNRDAHDKFQTHPNHLELIEANRENVKSMRVFDAYLAFQAQQADPPADN